MPHKMNLDFSSLEAGFEFPTKSFQLDRSLVDRYLIAVEEKNAGYTESQLVPPAAIATFSLTALSQGLSFPPGSIHVSQRIEFKDTVQTGDTITCHARVSKANKRGTMHFVTIALKVTTQDNREVQEGELVFILPQ
jgi:hypothetical protein